MDAIYVYHSRSLLTSVFQGSGICYLLCNSGNERVSHLISRLVGHPLLSVDELLISNSYREHFGEKGKIAVLETSTDRLSLVVCCFTIMASGYLFREPS